LAAISDTLENIAVSLTLRRYSQHSRNNIDSSALSATTYDEYSSTAYLTKTAKNVLGSFLNDVQAQNGKHLTSEAYALLYFNGKYLVDHL
jgi:hypothetical protein